MGSGELPGDETVGYQDLLRGVVDGWEDNWERQKHNWR